MSQHAMILIKHVKKKKTRLQEKDVASVGNIFFQQLGFRSHLFVFPSDPLPAILGEIVNRKVRNNESYFTSAVPVTEVESTKGTRTVVTEPKQPSSRNWAKLFSSLFQFGLSQEYSERVYMSNPSDNIMRFTKQRGAAVNFSRLSRLQPVRKRATEHLANKKNGASARRCKEKLCRA